MLWIYLGYLGVYIAVVLVWGFLDRWLHPERRLELGSRLLVALGAFSLLGGEFLVNALDEGKVIRTKLKSGVLRKKQLLLSGVLLGLLVTGIVAIIFATFLHAWLEAGVGISLILIFGSPLGLVLYYASERRDARK